VSVPGPDDVLIGAPTAEDRLGDPLAVEHAGPFAEDAVELLAQWCEVAAGGDGARFARRLRWLGLAPDDASAAVARLAHAARAEREARLPSLRAILGLRSGVSPEQVGDGLLVPEQPLPFEDVLMPIVRLARRLLDRALEPGTDSLLAPSAMVSLERHLLAQLADVGADPLFEELTRDRPIGHQLLGLFAVGAGTREASVSERAHYERFVRTQTETGLAGICRAYPALGPLLAALVDGWVDATSALIRHLRADLPALLEQFGPPGSNLDGPADPERRAVVAAIECGLSDPHRAGRSVAVLTFSSGWRLVYKPRGLGMECAYADLLRWFEQQGVALALRPVGALDRGDHGWMEYVDSGSCADLAAARRFYVRVGELACLLYVLGGSDWHCDNLIAAGEHPVLIDLETLFQPGERTPSCGSQSEPVHDRPLDALFWSSVLRTGLLPHWELGDDETAAYDLSALGGYGSQPSPWPTGVWHAVNTDAMCRAWQTGTLPLGQNVPALAGSVLEPPSFVGEICTGFEAMYRVLMRNRDTLEGPSSPLHRFAGHPIRFILRDTGLYYAIRRRTLSLAALRAGVTREIALEVLARTHLAGPDRRGAADILQAEISALRRLDIPYFTVPSITSTALDAGDTTVEAAFASSGLDRAFATLRSLSEADLGRQLALVRGALAARAAHGGPMHVPSPGDAGRAPGTQREVGPNGLLAEVRRVANDLRAAAVTGPDGSLGWVGLTHLGASGRFQLMPLGDSLYDGVCGIALFFAALARSDGDADAAEVALAALRPLRDLLHDPGDAGVAALTRQGIGGLAGLGSVVLTLTRISGLLGDPALLEDARIAAQLIRPALIATDRSYDVLTGAAGAILALLALHRAGSYPAALETANACGRHLLAHRTACASRRAWIADDEDRPLTGLSHGAAGIAYGLYRLYEATGMRAYLDAAHDGIAYERAVFSARDANWPDLRRSAAGPATARFGHGWCHGAPGIALGRIGCLAIQDEPGLRDEIEIALRTTEAAGLGTVDHLCCGNLGRAEVMLIAATRLAEPRWRTAALDLAARVIDRAHRTGAYCLQPGLDDPLLMPGLFQGVAGIGYGLLRLARPDLVPSVLLSE
jgi:type 2 lantibiotic biosynthesis protein LanM